MSVLILHAYEVNKESSYVSKLVDENWIRRYLRPKKVVCDDRDNLPALNFKKCVPFIESKWHQPQ